MSFILDALKKSENERQRQVGPSLADVQVSRRRNEKPWWVVAVAALLVVNLGVLLVVLTRGDARPASQGAGQAAQQDAAAAQQPQRNSTSTNSTSNEAQQYGGTQIPAGDLPLPAGQRTPPSPAVHSLADEADAHDYGAGVAAAAALVPEGPPMVRPIEAPWVAPATTRAAADPRAAAEQEMLPTFSDITASGTSLPELHLDIHVNSGNPAERFIFVNMRKYTEGQTLSEGPTVERITADGVILNHRGLRFLLPRQ
jgi:general secretion pathway protein B